MTEIRDGLPPNDFRLFLRTISMATPEQVIMLGRESADHIDTLEARVAELGAKFKRMALDCMSAHGQAMDAYQAQIEAEAKLDEAADTIDAQAATIKALVEALWASVATIEDYLAYEHDGDPWTEDARAMREMDIDDYAKDGRLTNARAALAAAKETPHE